MLAERVQQRINTDRTVLKLKIQALVRSTDYRGYKWTTNALMRATGCTNELAMQTCLQEMVRDGQLLFEKPAAQK